MYFVPPLSAQLPEPYTVATLPPAGDNPRKYAWVTDLHGSQPDYCISDGMYWKPVRPFCTQTMPASTMTWNPLVNAPTIIITGTIGLGVTLNFTLGTTLAYPGCTCRVVRKATGLGNLLTSLGLGLVSNAWADHEYDGSAWQSTATGGLL